MSIRIRRLDDGWLVTDDRGPVVWEAAAVTMADAQALADNRLNPRGPSAPPGAVHIQSVTPPGAPLVVEISPLAALQFAQATGDAPCTGSLCGTD